MMNFTLNPNPAKRVGSVMVRLLACLMLFMMHVSYAGPGAHGPNGEHLDTPEGAHTHSHSEFTKPRMETFSETFELVATLEPDELSILIDRYETNEPVLRGKVEVEAEGIKATSQFHSDHGDYSVTDPRLLKALSKPGQHALVFTVFANNDTDLLEGTLNVQASHMASPIAANTVMWREWGKTASIAGIGVAIAIGCLCLKRRRSQATSLHLDDRARKP